MGLGKGSRNLVVMVRISVREWLMSIKVLTYIDVQVCVEKELRLSSFFAILHSSALIDSKGMKCLFHVTKFCLFACRPVRGSFHMIVETEKDTLPPPLSPQSPVIKCFQHCTIKAYCSR